MNKAMFWQWGNESRVSLASLDTDRDHQVSRVEFMDYLNRLSKGTLSEGEKARINPVWVARKLSSDSCMLYNAWQHFNASYAYLTTAEELQQRHKAADWNASASLRHDFDTAHKYWRAELARVPYLRQHEDCKPRLNH